jgi:hypothetical protein
MRAWQANFGQQGRRWTFFEGFDFVGPRGNRRDECFKHKSLPNFAVFYQELAIEARECAQVQI